MDPISLRSVRPFIMDDIHLMTAAEEDGFDVNDQVAVSAFLKSKAGDSFTLPPPVINA